MEKLSQILSEETFLNAFRICKKLCATDSSRDVNIRLVAKHMTGLSEANIKNFYNKYIATDLVFAVPELFASDVVFIPKRLTGVREYRYFPCFSMILYNAIGLVFMECCDQFVGNLNFSRKGVYCYRPTRFVRDSNGKEWVAKNDYRVEYKAFSDRCKKEVESGDVVLQIDVGSYYETIKHSALTGLIGEFAPESALKRLGFSEASFEALNFYLDSMMGSNRGIPQGRKNLVSDYLGHLYLTPFDMAVSELSQTEGLNFKCSVRYVDDIFIVFTKGNVKMTDEEVYRKLLHVEQRVSSWLHKNLGLNLQPEKTQRRIVTDDTELDEFWEEFLKAVSSPPAEVPDEKRKKKKSEIEGRLDEFCKSLDKLRFHSGGTFDLRVSDDDREVLKEVFESNFSAFLLKLSNQKLVKKSLLKVDFDLTADHISILSTLLLLKSKGKSPYIGVFEDFLKKRLDLSDKRHVHILFEMLAAGLPLSKVRRFIKSSKDLLVADNYGKYLAVFSGLGDDLDDGSVHARLSREFASAKVPLRTFLFKSSDPLTILIADLVKTPDLLCNESIVQPLKLFMCEFRGGRWDTAFNHFHNFFHELCKNRLTLTDTDSVNKIVERITGLTLEEELVVLQFYDRRNFNAVSHPSKDGQPAVKVNRADLDSFMSRILKIVKKHLLN